MKFITTKHRDSMVLVTLLKTTKDSSQKLSLSSKTFLPCLINYIFVAKGESLKTKISTIKTEKDVITTKYFIFFAI